MQANFVLEVTRLSRYWPTAPIVHTKRISHRNRTEKKQTQRKNLLFKKLITWGNLSYTWACSQMWLLFCLLKSLSINLPHSKCNVKMTIPITGLYD